MADERFMRLLAVSRSEATQQKRFLVLDATWQVQETIHLDIGPRHFSIQDHGDAAEAPPHVPEDVRSGDRWHDIILSVYHGMI